MIVAVDVDETVAPMFSEWLRRYNERSGDCVLVEDITAWDVRAWVKPDWVDRFYAILSEPDLYRFIVPIPGARAAINRLRAADVRVVFASSCVPGTEHHKVAWLTRYGFLKSDGEFISTSNKGLVRADALIDDGPHNLSVFDGQRFLINQPHNQMTLVGQRVANIGEAVDIILGENYTLAP